MTIQEASAKTFQFRIDAADVLAAKREYDDNPVRECIRRTLQASTSAQATYEHASFDVGPFEMVYRLPQRVREWIAAHRAGKKPKLIRFTLRKPLRRCNWPELDGRNDQ